MKRGKRERAARALLFYAPFLLPSLLFLVVFHTSLDYGFVWTDEGEIVSEGLMLGEAPILEALLRPMHSRLDEALPGASQPYYRPLQVIVVNLVDRHLGRVPRNFHAIGFALGASTTLLFTWLAWVLCGSRVPALLCGAIVAVHPVLIEVHVWIAGLSNALAGGFLIASLLLAALAFRSPEARWAHGLAAGSAAMLVPALLSKENSVVAPLLLLALALSTVAQRDDRIPSRGPHFAACARWLVPVQAALVLGYAAVLRPAVLGSGLAGAHPMGGDLGVHLATSLASWPASLGWLFLPLESTSSDVVRLAAPLDLRVLTSAALVVGSVALWLYLLRQRQPLAALALAWVWIGFAPSSGVIPLTHARGERYLYLSLYGLALLPAIFTFRPALGTLGRRWVAAGLGVLFVGGLTERTLERLPDWRSDQTLFRRDFERDPLYREGAFMLARAQLVAGEARAAKDTLESLIERLPDFQGHASYLRESDFAELYCLVNLQLGRASDSLSMLDWIEPSSPNPAAFENLYYCAALTFEALGQPRRAASIQERLVALAPRDPDPRHALALARCHLALGEPEEARRWLRVARPGVQSDPSLKPEFNRISARIARVGQSLRERPGAR